MKITLLRSIVFLGMMQVFSEPLNLPPPYNIELLPYNAHGFYQNAVPMEEIINKYHVKTVIEVGSWLGTSTRHIAILLPADGKVYAVDHWKGSPEHQPGQTYWIPQLDVLYEQFLSNVIHAGLHEKIVPIRMDSLQASRELVTKVQPDLIYIDASHEYEAVLADLRAWYPYVRKRGILCGDDWGWAGVIQAVTQFAKENRLKIETSGAFWHLHR